MANFFSGTFDQLQQIVKQTGYRGNWSEDNGKFVFRTDLGPVMTWWESKGTLLFQGKETEKNKLCQSVCSFLDRDNSSVVDQSSSSLTQKQIFIVHGHDTDARDQLELVLRRLKLEPCILMNTSGEGKTIIEALEGKIGKNYESAFGIVLMTPDDHGYAIKDGPDKIKPRARQNVILEAGMLLSSLTRERIVFIVKGHVEIPSDIEGIIRLGYNTHVKEIVPKLAKRLQEVGFEISACAITSASI